MARHLVAEDQKTAVRRGARARYGGKLGDHGTYRVYGLGFERGNTVTSDGTDAMDDWAGRQAGFRTDWSAAANALTLQGDLFDNPIGRASCRERVCQHV